MSLADALQNSIDGKWVDALDGDCFDVFNHATGEVIATAPHSKPADAEAAVQVARRTFDDGTWWPATPARERGRVLLRAVEIVRREHERLAQLESLDVAKPIGEARDDIAEVAFMFEYYGGWATKIAGESQHMDADAMFMVWKEPVGVAVGITPWNYPMMMATQKVAPAIAAGCTFILKPPEQTPLTCLELPRVLEEAGLPTGAFHVLTGFGETAGAPLVAHPGVDKVGFTGSREVGKLILRSGAARSSASRSSSAGNRRTSCSLMRKWTPPLRDRRTACSGTRAHLFRRHPGLRGARDLRRHPERVEQPCELAGARRSV